jgi:hypothetical protein
MRRKEIPERVKGFKPQHMRIGNLQTPTLVIERMDTAKHALDSKKIHLRMCGGASCKKAPFPASDLNFQETGLVKGKRQRPARIFYCNYHRIETGKPNGSVIH